MILITSGKDFTDIDGLACCVAYKEYLGVDARIVLPGVLNQSITNDIRSWNLECETTHNYDDYDLVLMDISDPAYISNIFDTSKVAKVYDHRVGFEDYWRKNKVDAVIDPVGAAATLVWETVGGMDFELSTMSVDLLCIAIVSNTLNFQASTTTSRDKEAFKKLHSQSSLKRGWIQKYFQDQVDEITSNISLSLKNDTGIYQVEALGMVVISQMELWDGSTFIDQFRRDIQKVLESYNEPFRFITIPSISEGKNYLYTENDELKVLLSKTIKAQFNGHKGETRKLWLRKEILRELQKIRV